MRHSLPLIFSLIGLTADTFGVRHSSRSEGAEVARAKARLAEKRKANALIPSAAKVTRQQRRASVRRWEKEMLHLRKKEALGQKYMGGAAVVC